MTQYRILLADDHVLVRAGIRSLLEKLPDTEIVGEAGDGREALNLVQTRQPNIVLMDVAMPGLNGLEAVARIRKDFPAVKVIILSMHANEEYVIQALRAGASGYLLKDAATVELELALLAMARGENYLSPAISKRVIDNYVARVNGQSGPLEQLTSRQREILQLIAEGKNAKEKAAILNVSVKTIETHRAQLMDRLDIHDVPGLVRYAIRMGLVTVEK